MNSAKKYNWKNDTESQIVQFYAGKHVFLTGCTGFCGTLILEKLLRTCTDIGKIYIMIRPKKNVTMQKRMEELFQCDVFDKLRAMNPNFTDKVIVIHGDLYKPDLGLSAEDRQRLVNNVNIIIHNASMVYFKAKVSVILRTNVLGTQKMLELAAECPNLNVFVYMSTAYSHHYTKTIEEKFYAPPCDLKMIEDIIRVDEENAAGISKEALDDIVGKWMNQYAFSKAVTEGIVEDFGKRRSLPCFVYRPSIVTETQYEPIKAWVGNKNGPVSLTLGLGLGVLHVMYMDENLRLDFIPGDYTNNSLLAAIWDYVEHRETDEPQVYNYASSDWQPFVTKVLTQNFRTAIEKYPTSKMIWYPTLCMVSNKFLFLILHTIWHVIPAIIIDAVLLTRGKKPKATEMLFKVLKHHKILLYFISSSWVIKTDRTKRILSRMNAADLKLFPFDLKQIDWAKKMEMGLICVRRLMKEPYDSIPDARKKLQKLRRIHYTVVTLLGLFSLFLMYRIMCTLSFI